ncbi:MAG: hypothetical protein ACUVXI_16465 [bacterium]
MGKRPITTMAILVSVAVIALLGSGCGEPPTIVDVEFTTKNAVSSAGGSELKVRIDLSVDEPASSASAKETEGDTVISLVQKDDHHYQTDGYISASGLRAGEYTFQATSGGWMSATDELRAIIENPDGTREGELKGLGISTSPSPEDGATVSELSPTLTWQNDDPNVQFYEVAIYHCDNVIHESGKLTSPSYTVPPGLLQKGFTYKWRVRAGEVIIAPTGNVLKSETGGALVPKDEIIIKSSVTVNHYSDAEWTFKMVGTAPEDECGGGGEARARSEAPTCDILGALDLGLLLGGVAIFAARIGRRRGR